MDYRIVRSRSRMATYQSIWVTLYYAHIVHSPLPRIRPRRLSSRKERKRKKKEIGHHGGDLQVACNLIAVLLEHVWPQSS